MLMSLLQPSTHRPLRLQRRGDLLASRVTFRDEEQVVVKDPISLKFFRLTTFQHRVLNAMNGERSLVDIQAAVQDAAPAGAVIADILRVIVDLGEKGLIWSGRMGTVGDLRKQATEHRRRSLCAALANPLFIRLPGLHPGKSLQCLSGVFGWMDTPASVALAAVFVIGSWLFLLTQSEAFLHQLRALTELTTLQNLWMMWLAIGLLKIVHELSHGIACVRRGAECHSIGLALLFFSPCMYCDVTDAWLLTRKSQRIAISLAGLYAELLVSTACLWLWWFSASGAFHQACLHVFLAGSVGTFAVNANPLMRYDAYYVLSDLIEIPNLQQRSRAAVGNALARVVLGAPSQPQSSKQNPRTEFLLLTYGLSAMALQAPLLGGIGLFLFKSLEAIGLQILAIAYFTVLATLAICRCFLWSQRMLSERKSPRTAGWRCALAGGCSLGLLCGISQIPLGGSTNSAITIEPRAKQTVYIETPGLVRHVNVSEGDRVQAGDVLIELENVELDRGVVALEGVLASHEIDLRMARANREVDLMSLAETAIESAVDQVQFARAEMERLSLKAAISGRIVSSEAPSSSSHRRLDERLNGAYLNRGERLCEIAPDQRWQGSMWVDQRSLQFVHVGQSVDIRLEAYPSSTLTATVDAVASANESHIPATVSQRYGGSIKTSAQTGGETGDEPLYRIALSLTKSDLTMQPGMRGIGRYSRPPRTVGTWLMEEFHQLFLVGR